MTELKEHIKITSGFALDSNLFNKTRGFPVIRIRDVDRGYTETYYQGECDEKYIVKNGDLLVTMDGEFRAKVWNGGEAYLNQRVCKVEADEDRLSGRYLKYALPQKLKEIEDKTSFVTVKHLSVNDIKEINVHLPNLEDQERIADLLDKANSIRQKRRETLRLADEFLRSTFLEMFGDPFLNPKNWNMEPIDRLKADEPYSIKAGPFGSALKKEFYVKSGYKIYGQEQVIRDNFEFGDYYITEEKYRELENCKIESDDILISLVGTFGEISIVPKEFQPGIINPRLMKITLNKKKILPIFFKTLLKTNGIKTKLESLSHGGTMNIVNVGIIKELEVPVPPLKLQEKFIEIHIKTEKLKKQYETSLQESENLFNSLMQRAFRGEL
ncbi:MAG: restriction endonuclease subunit S [Melioribacteraceae bacterium]|nr:MAG: restriction endonuclease subunit S [Melioribacteraceae bacterium]